jgi:hypothetical protein
LIAVSDGVRVHLFDESGAWIGTGKGAKGEVVESRADPGVMTATWPLWVGATWQTRYTFEDVERGRTFRNVTQVGRVEAYEDVQTPGGPMKAFRISREVPGYYRITYWLSPDWGNWLKWREERTAADYLGAGTASYDPVKFEMRTP